MTYYFILGNNPDLSKAEIESICAHFGIAYVVSYYEDRILILKTEKTLPIQEFNNRLGGTIKIGEILLESKNIECIEKTLLKESERFSDEKKMYFGISLYTTKIKRKTIAYNALRFKKTIKNERGISSRYVVSKENDLSSVIVKKNKLLSSGIELCVFYIQNNYVIGKTLAVQQFEEFSYRDYGRPARDDVSGMIPPKLARILLNLGNIKDAMSILDPFCGSGTIIQEGILLGYKNIIGSDVSPKAISDTKENLEWLSASVHASTESIRLIQSDISELSNYIEKESIDRVITEPYLGPPLKGVETPQQIQKIIEDLNRFYKQLFKYILPLVKNDGVLVLIVPEITMHNKSYEIDISSMVENTNFHIASDNLSYSRPNQHIKRKIYILNAS